MIPRNLSAFAGKSEDFEWTRIEPLPAKPREPTRIEDIPSPVAAETVSADEFVKRMDAYYDKILKIPDCHAQLLAKAAAAKEAQKLARKLKRGKQ